MANILLLGAGGNAGINFTKCLHMSKHNVIGVDLNDYYLNSSNSNIKLHIDFSRKTEEILSIIKNYKIDLVHAQPDVEVKYLLSTSELKNYIFPHNLEIWEKFSDKLECQRIWSNSIKNFIVASYKDVCKYPVLFSNMLYKGNGKVWIRSITGAGSKAALPINNMQQAENWTSYWREMRGISENEFMFCQYLPGKEYAVQTFWYNGQLIHSQARERLIYFFGSLMPSGQTSTPAVAKTVNENRIYETAYKAIQLIDDTPHGIYCVDMKENNEGDPIPTEVNYGRFFTTSDFFANIGVNTPDEYVKSTLPSYRPNIKISHINEEYYWIRGLDKEPKLVKHNELCIK